MKNIILLILILSNVIYANSYNNLLNKDIEGAIRVAKSSSDIMESANLGHAYILSGKFDKATIAYGKAIKFSKEVYKKDYDELYSIYPNKKELLDKGWEILKKQFIEKEQWEALGISSDSINDWSINDWKNRKFNINQAKAWIKNGVTNPEFILNLIKIGILTPSEYKPYNNIRNINHIKILKSLNIKPTLLIERMSEFSTIYFQTLFFKSKERFKKRLSILKNNGCKTIEKIYFSDADVYDNEGLCYVFGAELIQRLDRYTGLASGLAKKIIFVKFDKSWSEGDRSFGIIKGLGNYSYQTTSGATKNVAKGKVLFKN